MLQKKGYPSFLKRDEYPFLGGILILLEGGCVSFFWREANACRLPYGFMPDISLDMSVLG